MCEQLAAETSKMVEREKPFAVIGGDHSCAIGTWSGVAKALRSKGDLGLIWIDAHLVSRLEEISGHFISFTAESMKK